VAVLSSKLIVLISELLVSRSKPMECLYLVLSLNKPNYDSRVDLEDTSMSKLRTSTKRTLLIMALKFLLSVDKVLGTGVVALEELSFLMETSV
jgi:hypothetical protein